MLSSRLNTTQLKFFSIKNLFGTKDINIPFEKESLILIAENGAGKTTILNILYYILSSKFRKLSSVEFDSVKLEFKSGECIEFSKDDLVNLSSEAETELISILTRSFPPSQVEKVLELIELDVPRSVLRKRITDMTRRYGTASMSYIEHLLDEISHISEAPKKTKKRNIDPKREVLKKNLKEQVLYFPTYRRIEEELKNLGYEGISFEEIEKSNEKLIQFGMDDVVARFNKIKSDIKNSIVDSFSKLSGDMLTQLVEGISITPEMKNQIRSEVLKIVLSRVGDKNISYRDRQKIESLVETAEIFSGKYDQLIYLLSKLIDVYEQQRDKDEAIKNFTEICNQYLNNKKVVYDETTVDISIVETKTGKPIEIRNLSSGEKQIISIFSKMYLDYSNDFVLLFDEPELSLSLEWQRMLLPDILKAGKCKFLIAVTHSPFIFDNELDLNAVDLDRFVVEK
ncbi:ATP-binding protein [Kovacikia minuta CCNUW1]|uniref:AAA family ATPase n=1 Tax=Kovacikia minuta TaxID=2931930 RepID=UPI001CCC0C33|nr:AAA family ATPase [Kovacikia minuta]UBF23973.1 ATP-binding protein [Kovacikia minuta CCNUW1]